MRYYDIKIYFKYFFVSPLSRGAGRNITHSKHFSGSTWATGKRAWGNSSVSAASASGPWWTLSSLPSATLDPRTVLCTSCHNMIITSMAYEPVGISASSALASAGSGFPASGTPSAAIASSPPVLCRTLGSALHSTKGCRTNAGLKCIKCSW